MPNIHALIMAGGAGTRFWPASRRLRPKQLLALVGETSLLRQTLERVAPLASLERTYISVGRHLVDATLEAAPELARARWLIEPAARNTAPCIGWAAAAVARDDPEGIVMALPADHHVADAAGFRKTMSDAIEHARTGVVTTIGIRPTRPETGFGYIEAAPGPGPVHDVVRFVEKPDLESAQAFLEYGTFLWNAGIFVFRARDMLEAINRHMPRLGNALGRLDELEQLFPTLEAVSIDTGVVEKMERLAVVPGDFGWSDVGSWLAAAELAPHDANGNSTPASTVLSASVGNYVVDMRTDARKRVIALVGVCDLVVVETDDALLVAHKDQSQRVRDVVEALKARGDEDFS